LKFIFIFLFFASTPALAQWSQQKVTNTFGALDYHVYTPAVEAREYRGLILALHGCKQSPQDFATIARLSELAEREHLVLVLPEQSSIANVDRCWDWFMTVNQSRNTGEPSQYMMAIDATKDRLHITAAPTYVLGMSAGAIMANVMASCFPDVFSGVAIHSGMEFANPLTLQDAIDGQMRCPTLSSSESARLAVACSGLTPQKWPNVIIFHGDQDQRVYPCNSDSVFDQWLKMAGDDSATPHIHSETTAAKDSFLQKDLADTHGWRIRQVTVHNMAHAWSGGPPQLFASDPNGPDATSMIWDFFNNR
jgi:poly(hydroxyalkanoate) depolymerase family esterase